jgi:hypothetical protein
MYARACKLLVAVCITVTSLAASASGGGYDKGKAEGACYFVPASGVENQPFTVYVQGLPTDREVDLFILNYEWGTHNYVALNVNPDGSWFGTFTIPADGNVKFEFNSPSTNASRLADRDAVCTIKLASA